jgi:hypothetical protein
MQCFFGWTKGRVSVLGVVGGEDIGIGHKLQNEELIPD